MIVVASCQCISAISTLLGFAFLGLGCLPGLFIIRCWFYFLVPDKGEKEGVCVGPWGLFLLSSLPSYMVW